MHCISLALRMESALPFWVLSYHSSNIVNQQKEWAHDSDILIYVPVPHRNIPFHVE